jgi:SPP1 family predicted phage head-tail adaptor
MQSGRLRHRVTVQVVSMTQNSYGEPVQTWTDVGTVWAQVLPARGQERFVASGDQQLATVTHTVEMRYLDGMSPVNHRLQWGTQILDIESVLDTTGKTASMRVLCREEISEGTITALYTGDYNLDFSVAANSMYLGAI